MDVFISWSGDKSRDVALVLREWLPLVMNSLHPFVSSKDIYAGTRWQVDIASQLQASNFGILCVTNENQKAPWLNFEAGAIAKAVDVSRVVPLAIDLKPSDISLPLGQFQGQPATEDGIGTVLESLNAASVPPLQDALLERAAAKWWPDLETELATIQQRYSQASPVPSGRSDRELLEETLDTIRSLARRSSFRGSGEDPIPRAHPAVREIARLLETSMGDDFVSIRHARSRALGLSTKVLIPDEVREEAERLAAIYAIRLDYFPQGGSDENKRVMDRLAVAFPNEDDQ